MTGIRRDKDVGRRTATRGRALLPHPFPNPDHNEHGRLERLLHAAPGLIAVVDGPDHTFRFANRAWLSLTGSAVVGRPLRDVLPQADAGGLLALLNAVRAGGSAAAQGERRTLAIAPRPGKPAIDLDFVCRPEAAAAIGVGRSIVLQGTDVTERVLNDELQHLMMHELTHRVKNTSATMLGLARLARGSATDLDSFLTALTDRTLAMCRTHDLLSLDRDKAVQLSELLALEFAPYEGDETRLEVVGGDLPLTAASATSLSMIIHELLTNAVKYGALSSASGKLKVRCEAVGRDGRLTWSETSAHPIAPMGQGGFGSRLIEILAQRLGGAARIERRCDGLDVTVTFTVEPEAEIGDLA